MCCQSGLLMGAAPSPGSLPDVAPSSPATSPYWLVAERLALEHCRAGRCRRSAAAAYCTWNAPHHDHPPLLPSISCSSSILATPSLPPPHATAALLQQPPTLHPTMQRQQAAQAPPSHLWRRCTSSSRAPSPRLCASTARPRMSTRCAPLLCGATKVFFVNKSTNGSSVLEFPTAPRFIHAHVPRGGRLSLCGWWPQQVQAAHPPAPTLCACAHRARRLCDHAWQQRAWGGGGWPC